MDIDLKEIGRRIRDLRKSSGWSQARLADKAGVDPSTVSNIENGKQDTGITRIGAIADALNIELAELFSLGEETPSSDRSTGEQIVGEDLAEWRTKLHGARGLIDDLSDEELARIVRIVRAVEGDRKKDEAD